MKTKTLIIITTMTLCIMFSAANGFADVPAPPVNQNIGMADVTIASLTEADCRICHSSGIPDLHHILYGSEIPDPSSVLFPDSDGDGLRDGEEDSDRNGQIGGDLNDNGIWDNSEEWTETDPLNNDSDRDGINDGVDGQVIFNI